MEILHLVMALAYLPLLIVIVPNILTSTVNVSILCSSTGNTSPDQIYISVKCPRENMCYWFSNLKPTTGSAFRTGNLSDSPQFLWAARSTCWSGVSDSCSNVAPPSWDGSRSGWPKHGKGTQDGEISVCPCSNSCFTRLGGARKFSRIFLNTVHVGTRRDQHVQHDRPTLSWFGYL